MADYGFVYCLSNESMPGIYKIGMTKLPPSIRALQLSRSTSCALPFEVCFYMETPRPDRYERALHSLLDDERANSQREFFKCRLREIYEAFVYLSDQRYAIALANFANGEMASDEYINGAVTVDFSKFGQEDFEALECA